MKQKKLFLLIIFLTGATSLIYQILWIREFSLLFGVHVYSLSTVLAAFMAGLALGSYVFGRLADRFPQKASLLFFSTQVLIGLFALLFNDLLQSFSNLFVFLSQQYNLSFQNLNLLRPLVGFFLLLIPASFMGAVIPLTSRIFVKQIKEVGGKVSLIYYINNLGAVVGCFLAGFVLVYFWGTHTTLQITASINFLIGISGVVLYFLQPASSNSYPKSKHPASEDQLDTIKKEITAETTPLPHPIIKTALWVFAIEGFTTLAYQVLWTRMMIEFSFEKTIYFTTIIIMSFILGLALGGLVFNKIHNQIKNHFRFIGIIQVLVGLSSLGIFIIFHLIAPGWIQNRGQFPTWQSLAISEYTLILIMMSVPTFFTGMTFPLVAKIITRSARKVGSRVGFAGMLDTVGSVLGSLAAGFLLLPFLGVYWSFIIIVFSNLVLAGWIFSTNLRYMPYYSEKESVIAENAKTRTKIKSNFRNREVIGYTIVILLAVIAVILFPKHQFNQLQSQYFRGDRTVFHKEGIAATVRVNLQPSGHYALSINGAKTAFTNNDDLRVHRMLAWIPWLLNPTTQSTYVIGFGMGVTSGTLSQLPTEQIKVADICPELLDAAHIFADYNNNIIHHQKFHFIPEDGRSFLLRTPEKFDIITSNAVHSRLNANLYTREFYEICKEKINPGGIVTQWVPTNWLTDDEFKSLISAFTEVFEHSQLWYITRGHVVLAGSNSPLVINYNTLEKLFYDRANYRDLQEVDIYNPQSFLANLMLSNKGLEMFARGPLTNYDDQPYVEFSREIDLKPNTGILSELATSSTAQTDKIVFPNLPDSTLKNNIFDVIESESNLIKNYLNEYARRFGENNHNMIQTKKDSLAVVRSEINATWVFRQVGNEKWYPATVPGTVHKDLLNNGLIDDPFFRKQEDNLQWIEEKDWEYKCSFYVNPDIFNRQIIELHFDGLDTYADVYLNDELILSEDNMFVGWKVNCKEHIKEGENELRIYFHSPVKKGMEKLKQLDYILEATNEQAPKDERTNVFTRKAPFHYGWDWGPRLVTSGIWRPIFLESRNDARINDLYLVTNKADEAEAEISISADIESAKKGGYSLSFWFNGKQAGKAQKITLEEGQNSFSFDVQLNQPKLWWPNGLGDSYLYLVEAKLEKDNQPVHTHQLDFGIRIVELVQNPDETGHSFQFEVNGIPVFMKGANVIPSETLTPSVSRETYEKMIRNTVDANMNMLRVWGGAIYEDDYFYQLCDQNGILVWQDFMFACALQPGDEKHLENIQLEAEYNVKRLRNHACIALWCGNNENLMAWHNWGWKDNYKPDISAFLWRTYERIFYDILPQAVQEFDPKNSYWSSSPMGINDQLADRKSGDEHDWTIWFGQKRFETFWDEVPRFVSEWGLQAFPPMETLQSFALPEDMSPDSEIMRHRQRSKMDWISPGFDGNDMIKRYMEWYYEVPEDFERFVYTSQLLQARGYKTAIEAHRSAMPHCMGSLYWQLNDCWPTISWATLDYNYRWKAAHYAVKEAFKPVIVTANQENNRVKAFAVSDQLDSFDASLKIRLMKFDGTILHEINKPISVKPNTSTPVLDMDISDFPAELNPEETLLSFSLLRGEKEIAGNILYFAEPKNLVLPKAAIRYDLKPVNEGYQLTLSSTNLIKDLFIDVPDSNAFVSNNYFDLLPGETTTITIKSGTTPETMSNIKFLHLN